MRSNVSLSEGHKTLRQIISSLTSAPLDWNEADTRFHLIDRLLIECFGWQKTPDSFRLEAQQDGEYRDYLLGAPPVVVWEAKRSGIYFDFPADAHAKIVQSIRDIFAVSKTVEAAIRQVQGYCNDSGIEFGVVCNGCQLIAFQAVRIGQSWLQGRALVIRNPQQLDREFATAWQCLSPDGIVERRLLSYVSTGSTRSIPRKASTKLSRFPSFRYKTELQTSLRTLSELLLEDLISTDQIRKQFYEQCYCQDS